jgi:hypothetical protein
MTPDRSRPLGRLCAALALALALHAVDAAPNTQYGNFVSDDEVRQFIVTMASDATLSVTSIGYAGGVDVNGHALAAGGFDTMLFLYDHSGTLIAQSDDGIGVPADPRTGLASDAAFSISLLSGLNLSDGFSEAGNGNFTPGLSGTCSATAFCDSAGNSRSSHFGLNFVGAAAVVPEPASALMCLAGIGVLAGAARRRRTQPGAVADSPPVSKLACA